MKVIYFNNCWFTNVGEAFIDIGGMELTRKIFGEGTQIACISAMSDYYISAVTDRRRTWGRNRKQTHEGCKMNAYLNADYVILPGMIATEEYLRAKSRKMIDDLVRNGCNVIFLGLGGA